MTCGPAGTPQERKPGTFSAEYLINPQPPASALLGRDHRHGCQGLPRHPPLPSDRTSPGLSARAFFRRQVWEEALVLVCLSDVRQPGHQEVDAEGQAWVRLSERPRSLVLLGISGPSADEEGEAGRPPFGLPLRLPSSPALALPLPSPFSCPLSLRRCPRPSPWPLHGLRGHQWAVCSPVWACPPRSPKTAYSAGAGSALVHSGLRPLGCSCGLKASIHPFVYLVSEASPEHLPLRCPGRAVTQSSLQETGGNPDSGHWEMREALARVREQLNGEV